MESHAVHIVKIHVHVYILYCTMDRGMYAYICTHVNVQIMYTYRQPISTMLSRMKTCSLYKISTYILPFLGLFLYTKQGLFPQAQVLRLVSDAQRPRLGRSFGRLGCET